jgi:two-component system, NarL family, sensor histidine kinase UhpB
MSLRARINLLITFLLLAFALGLTVIEVKDARNSIAEEIEAATKVSAQLLAMVGRQNASRTPQRMVEFLTELGRVRANDIKLFDSEGNQRYASPPSRYKSGRDAPAWFTKLVAPKAPAVNVALPFGKLIITPDVSRSVLDSWDDLRALLWLILLLFVVLNVLVFWLAGRVLHPVKDIVAGLQQMERMQFHTRLPKFPLPELDAIGSTFNRVAQAVEDGFAARERAERSEHELQENREMNALIQQHIEEERRNLARELHDELGQWVTAVRTIATSIVNKSKDLAPELTQSAATIVDVSGKMYDAMHGMVRRLRPLALDLGLGDALRDLVTTNEQRYPQTHFTLQLAGDLQRLPEQISITAYRIAQECLTNVARHAGATRALVRAARVAVSDDSADDDQLELAVIDDGRGSAQDIMDKEGHYGVRGMRERVQALGGSFEVRESPQQGVSIYVRLPLGAKHGSLAATQP